MTYDVQDFESDVLKRSHEIPVVVDFWAEWCGPCKVLGPVLERLAAKNEDRFLLAKLDTELHPEIASQYGVNGIPNVKLFVDGKIVDEFVGALPERTVQRWLNKVLPSRQQKRVDEAKELLGLNNTTAARQLLWDVIGTEPENSEARVLLARTYVFSEPEKASSLVVDITDPKVSELAEAIQSFAHLIEIREKSDSLPASETKLKYLQAIEDVCAQRFDAALEKFIDVIRTDRSFDDDGARKACIAIFKYLGEDNPITQRHRRDFSSALY